MSLKKIFNGLLFSRKYYDACFEIKDYYILVCVCIVIDDGSSDATSKLDSNERRRYPANIEEVEKLILVLWVQCAREELKKFSSPFLCRSENWVVYCERL